MLWVKLCGMTSAEDALAAAEAGADAIGLIFAPSKRRVDVETAKEIVRQLPHTLEKVGLFVNEASDRVEEVAIEVGLTAVQLQGEETPEFARSLFRTNPRKGRGQVRVFKTLHVVGGVEDRAQQFLETGCVDGLLLDSTAPDPVTGEMQRGGTGKIFDWKQAASLLPTLRGKRVIVAGGLTPSNVAAAVHTLHPWGVDVCSSVEREPGKKDLHKLREFVTAARAARG